MSTNLYFTHSKMRTHISKIKRINNEARILGLDLGRKYVGVAISDKQILTCRVSPSIHSQNNVNIAVQNILSRSSAIHITIRLQEEFYFL